MTSDQMRLPFEAQRTVQERFEAFHRDNPHIYELLVKYAVQAARAGWRHYGVKSLFERVRWHVYVEAMDERGFKLNNDFTSRYARLLNTDPRVTAICGPEFFETRELKAR